MNILGRWPSCLYFFKNTLPFLGLTPYYIVCYFDEFLKIILGMLETACILQKVAMRCGGGGSRPAIQR